MSQVAAVVIVGWAAWFAVSLLLGWGIPPRPLLVIVAIIEGAHIARKLRARRR